MPLSLPAAAHIFVSVLILGTLWRIAAHHLMASNSVQAQHVGGAMTTQY
jgi:hypothetical protein